MVVPFFQPIIRTTDLGVFAYEVLAREERDGKVYSLGPYFEDPAVPGEDKLAVDACVRERAFAAYAAAGCDAKLFVNLEPAWVCMHRERHGTLPVLDMLERYGIDPQNIVIEVTEAELTGDGDVFGKLLSEYRKAGCMLAVDDFGKGASSMERIAHVTPDIIKIDHSIVRKTDTHRSFFDICGAMRSFGSMSGFDLLFEGVETASQLERCTRTGWCYLQGFLFSRARPGFGTDYDNRDLLSDILFLEGAWKRWNMERRNEVAAKMELEVERLRSLIPLEESALAEPAALRDFMNALPLYCVHGFVCDHSGRRLSRGDPFAAGDAATRFPRGVFTQGASALSGTKAGYLSGVHKNVATKEDVMTYMHRLDRDRLLCVDIMSTVLF